MLTGSRRWFVSSAYNFGGAIGRDAGGPASGTKSDTAGYAEMDADSLEVARLEMRSLADEWLGI